MKNTAENNKPLNLAHYLEAIIENAIDAIITIDEHGIVESMNPATVTLFGFSKEEVIGKNISVLMPQPYRREHDGYISNYKTTGHKKIIGIGREVEGLTKDGRVIPVRLAVSEATVEGKRIFIGTLHDMSEMKAAEAKIKKLNEELEQKVMQRTEELADVVNKLLDSNNQLMYEIQERKTVLDALRKSEAELKKSLVKEKELSELKSRFVTMASHEFRTPLSAILSSADIIEAYTQESPTDKRLKHTSRIKASVNTLTTILNDFLSLSKLEEDKVQLQPVEVDFKSFCMELMDELKDLLKPGQTIRHPDGLLDAKLFFDNKILKNILYNLLSNSIKYSANDTHIDCFTKLDGDHLVINITDYGIGISEEDQQHLFTRFFRAKNAENIQGTGLGLNIVRRYLDIMDGNITFQSRLGAGTTFTVSIPIFTEEQI